MSFKSYRNSRPGFRRNHRSNVAAQAESCELRALLSASAIIVGMSEVAPCDVTETEFGPGIDDLELADEDIFGQDLLVDEIPPSDDWDPSCVFRSFMAFYGVETDGEVIDEVKEDVDDTGATLDDMPPVEGWDPSWLFRSLTAVSDGDFEDYFIDQAKGWDDGLDCGVTLEGYVPGDEPFNDFDGDGLPDEFVMYPFDPMQFEGELGHDGLGCGVAPEGFVEGDVPIDDFDGDGLPDDFVMYPFDPLQLDGQLGEDGLGCGVAPDGFVEGDVTIYDFDGDGLPDDFVMYPFDPLPIEDIAGEPTDDGELVPIRSLDSSDFDLNVIFYSAAPGGIEVQRTTDNDIVPEETTSPLTLAFPVTPSPSNSVFSAKSGGSTIADSIGVQSNSPLAGNAHPAKRNATQKRSSVLVRTSAQSAEESEGLNNLTPLLDGDSPPNMNDAPENKVNPQAVESGPIEETVSNNGDASGVASGYAARQGVPARNAHRAMIEHVMAQYAENSFDS